MKKKSSSYYPMFLNIRGRKCVVVGGGQVALRKVKTLLAHGALVEVISPELTTELQRLVENGKIALKQRQFQSGDLQGAFIAVAATSDNRTNRKIAGEARESGIPVNVANDTVHSDFIVPSSLSRGDITVAVSTSGKSPALARKIRTMLEKELGEEYTLLVELVDEVRTELKKNGLAVDGDRWQEALDLDVLITVLKNEGREKAKTILLNALKMQRK
jgi:precorrin-2 dehydrogenase/sirohydrochlorin ferrochelatase